jgi:DNA-binding CsgD family transcriptional regulator
MSPFWIERSQWSECRTWLDEALRSTDLSDLTRARLLNCQCYLHAAGGQWGSVPPLANEALTLSRGVGDIVEEGRALGYLGVVLALGVGPVAARPYFEESVAIGRSNGDGWGLSGQLTFFSLSRLFQDNPDETLHHLDEAIATAREGGDDRWVRLAESVTGFARISTGRLNDDPSVLQDVIAESRRARHLMPLVLGLVADAWSRLLTGDFAGSLASATEGVDAAEAQETAAVEGVATWILGLAQYERGDQDESVKTLQRSTDLIRGSEMPRWVALPLVPLAHAHLDTGNQELAVSCLDEATEVASAAGYPWILGRIQQVRARISLQNDEHERAESHIHEALEYHQMSGDQVAWCDAIDLLATIWAARGHGDAALRMWGAAFGRREQLGCIELRMVAHIRRVPLDDARRALGQTASEFMAEGRGLDPDAATAYARGNRGKRGRPTSGWHSLTPAELNVVQLVARHRSNPEIAEQLFISRSTVKSHMVHIFAKLDIGSRSELAAEAIQHDMGS